MYTSVHDNYFSVHETYDARMKQNLKLTRDTLELLMESKKQILRSLFFGKSCSRHYEKIGVHGFLIEIFSTQTLFSFKIILSSLTKNVLVIKLL